MNYNYLVSFWRAGTQYFFFGNSFEVHTRSRTFLPRRTNFGVYFMFVLFLYEWTRKCISHIISRKYSTLLGQYYWILFNEYYVVKTAGKSQICSTIISNEKLAFQNKNSNSSMGKNKKYWPVLCQVDYNMFAQGSFFSNYPK